MEYALVDTSLPSFVLRTGVLGLFSSFLIVLSIFWPYGKNNEIDWRAVTGVVGIIFGLLDIFFAGVTGIFLWPIYSIIIGAVLGTVPTGWSITLHARKSGKWDWRITVWVWPVYVALLISATLSSNVIETIDNHRWELPGTETASYFYLTLTSFFALANIAFLGVRALKHRFAFDGKRDLM